MNEATWAMIENVYRARRDLHEEVLARLADEVRATVEESGLRATVLWRLKSLESLRAKLSTRRGGDGSPAALYETPDLLGLRVVCAFLSDLEVVERRLVRCFDVTEIERKTGASGYNGFGYEAVHVLLRVPAALTGSADLPEEMRCEVQLRTVLQHAWAEIEHQLVYKPRTSGRPGDGAATRRTLGAVSATLSLLDQTVEELRNSGDPRLRRVEPRAGSAANVEPRRLARGYHVN